MARRLDVTAPWMSWTSSKTRPFIKRNHLHENNTCGHIGIITVELEHQLLVKIIIWLSAKWMLEILLCKTETSVRFINSPLSTGIFLLHIWLNWFLRMASFMSRNMWHEATIQFCRNHNSDWRSLLCMLSNSSVYPVSRTQFVPVTYRKKVCRVTAWCLVGNQIKSPTRDRAFSGMYCSDIGVEDPGILLGRMNIILCLFLSGVVLYMQRPRDLPIPLFKETLGHWNIHQIKNARMG
jgi:hypothetical protein